MIERIQQFHKDRDELLRDAAVEVGLDPDIFVNKAIPQSELFMAENIRMLHDLYLSAPTNAQKTVLDIGPQAFGGTALLERLHRQSSFNKLKLKVTAVDITDKFDLLRQVQCPEVEFLHSNIYSIENRTWDVIICSHVIEHVPNPVKFLRRLTELARDYVIVACPWKENPLSTNGHINAIDRTLVQQVQGQGLEVFVNYNWGKDREVCLFWLAGEGSI